MDLHKHSSLMDDFPGSEGERWLSEERGISPETAARFGIGYDSGMESLVFPYWLEDGSIHRLKYRSGERQWWGRGEGIVPFGLPTLDGQQRIWLTEGETDALRLAQELPEEAVLGIPGASSVGCLKAYLPKGVILYACFDNDEAGKLATARAIEEYGARPVMLPGNVKDVCEYFLEGHTEEEFQALAERADAEEADAEAHASHLQGVVKEARGNTDFFDSSSFYFPSVLEEKKKEKPPSVPEIVSLGSLPEPPPLEYVVDGFIPKGYITTLYGDGGNGKSYFALSVASCVAAGLPFCSSKTLAGVVVYIDYELDEKATARNAYKVARGLGLEKPPDSLYYMEASSGLETVVSKVAKRNPVLTVVDSVGMALQGDSEKSRDAIAFMRSLRPLGTVLNIDHQSKPRTGESYESKDVFGSSYKRFQSRNVWQLRANKLGENELGLKLTHKKTNFGPLREPITLKATFGEAFALRVAELPSETFGGGATTRDRVLAALAELEEATAEDIARHAGIERKTANSHLTPLVTSGEVVKCGKRGKAPLYAPGKPGLALVG